VVGLILEAQPSFSMRGERTRYVLIHEPAVGALSGFGLADPDDTEIACIPVPF
jgi:hypothetical protein